MKLTAFRVTNYRSVNDSGWVDVAKMTTLVGRNESGKSNMLLALASLNPPGGPVALSTLKDFPRDRDREAFDQELSVVESRWSLDEEESGKLNEIYGRDVGVTEVIVARGYAAARTVRVSAAPATPLPAAEIKRKLKSIGTRVELVSESVSDSEAITAAWTSFENAALDSEVDAEDWAEAVHAAAKGLSKAVMAQNADLGPEELKLDEIDDEALTRLRESTAVEQAETFVLGALPTFIYVEDYAPIDGRIDLGDFVNRRQARQATSQDRNFAKLCKVAGLDPNELTSANPEDRALLTNRASAQVSRRIRALWSDRSLTVDFRTDRNSFDTYISDPNSDFPVLVNLDERSRGLRWFFSFFITYLADTNDGEAANAVLLLDEPGLFLHAGSQRDLLKFLKSELSIQSLYTTHSPFMIPHDDLDAVRTVNISPERGTVVTNDPSGDAKTMFPIQAALGYSLAQTLFVGPKNLVVEGVTDFWLLSSISNHLRGLGRTSLDEDAAITPAGGAQKVPTMVSLLTSQELDVVVLLDDEGRSRTTGRDLSTVHQFDSRSVIFVTDGFAADKPQEADIEDLLDPAIYIELAMASHADQLAGRQPHLEDRVPRVVRRLEKAFEALGLKFNKTKAARLFIHRMADEPDRLLAEASLARFERLFGLINARIDV